MRLEPSASTGGRALRSRPWRSLGVLALGGSIALLATSAAAQNRILSCRDANGVIILTDADKCPAGTTLEQRKVYDLPPKRAVPRQSGQPSASTGTRATPARSIPNGNSSKANERIAQAQLAACADLQQRKTEIDSLMQAASEDAGPSDQRFHEKLSRIEADRCRLGCQPC